MYQGKYANTEPPKRNPRRKSAKRTRGTIIFYSVYAACVVIFLVALLCVMNPLRDWLVKYEASQPNYKRDEVFAELFADPDWEKIYELANVEDTEFENSKTFAACMDKLVGDKELTCLETSAGLSGDKKYIVKLGDTKIATFTLTGGAEKQTDIPEWELGELEVFFTRNQSVIVERLPGQTVYINGVSLDDSYIICSTSTVAEEYLPEGVHGFRLEQLQVTGLLVAPEVTVEDADGNAVEVTCDSETGIYSQNYASSMEATTAEKELALNATQVYAKYMIGKATLGEVQKCFSTSSQFYKTISKSEIGWMQSFQSYTFTDAVYSDYYRYSDSLFSIKVDMILQLTRHDGSIKEHELNNTMFFEQNAQGKWIVKEATNISVQEQVSQVRLTFMDGDQIVSSELMDADVNSVTLPAVTAPEGKVLKGWVKQEIDDNGKTTLTVVFEPTEGGKVYLPSNTTLEPMTLYALYEEAAAA